jgi:RNA methyltransferase, TrmH family
LTGGEGELSQARARAIQRLRDRKGRVREGRVLVEGPRTLETALAGGAHFRYAVLAADASSDAVALAERLAATGVDVVRVSPEAFLGLCDTETPQGILGVADEPVHELSGEGGLPGPGGAGMAGAPGAPEARERVLVLDAVQDPGNAGTLVRSAAAFGASRVIALDGAVDLWNPKAVRASAGHAFSLPLHRLTAAQALEWVRGRGLTLLVADAAGTSVRESDAPGASAGPGFALVIGNEGAGPRPELLTAADHVVALPVAPGVDSLNAAIAGTVLLWHLSA